ncbi:MAG: hypothetical protein IT370_05415 [Deltaproteobacteria bacterium]|nr:hypothetical protein [Deltaproteobacteria bacterium]
MSRPGHLGRFGLAVLALTTLVTPAHANVADLFGLGAAASGRAGAVAATTTDWSASHYDPAGLAFGRGYHVALGVQATASRLSINDVDRPVTEPLGVTAGASLPAPLYGPLEGKVSIGLALYLLPTRVLRVIARLPSQPFFPYYDNRTQRLVALPAVAVRVHPKVGIGLAFNFLAGVAGGVRTDSGSTRALEPRVDEEVFATVKLNGGVRFDPRPGWSTALVFRQAFSVPFKADTQNKVAGDRIDLAIDAEGLVTPHTLVAGLGWTSGGGKGQVQAGLDLSWAMWSRLGSPFVKVTSRIPFVGPLEGKLPAVEYKDAFGVRAGVDVTALDGRDFGLVVRGGLGVETSPVPAQRGVTNLVDGTKVAMALGTGLRLGRVGKHAITVDAHVGLHLVTHVSYDKRVFAPGETGAPTDGLRDELPDMASDPSTLGTQVSNPGYPTLEGGGGILAGSLTLGVEL